MTRRLACLAIVLAGSSVTLGDWSDDFTGGLNQPWVFGHFNNFGGTSETFAAGALNGALQFYDPTPTPPPDRGARVGFGVVPTEVFSDVRVSGVLNPNGLPTLIDVHGSPFQEFLFVNDDLALLARGNLSTGTSYTLSVSYNVADLNLQMTRSDGFSSDDTTIAATALDSSVFGFDDTGFLEFELIGSTLTGRLFDAEGGSLLAEISATDSTYSSGVSGVAVERDAFANAMIGEFDNVSSVALVAAGQDADYNNDGLVDAIDYAVWRENLGGAAGALQNDPVGGAIGPGQLDAWRANFGAGAAAATPAPEPAGLSIFLFATAAFAGHRGKP